MEALLRHLLIGCHGLFAYTSIFGVLMACGLGVPLPEDVSLVLGGLLVQRGAAILPGMMLAGFLGILAGDSLIFLAGRRVGSQAVQRGWLARIVTAEKRARVEGLFARHGQKIVLVARFLPGVRAVTFFTAGSAGMGYLRFAFFDGLAALASAPLLVFLGYRFGNRLQLILEKVKQGQLAVVGTLLAVGLAAYGYQRFRRARSSLAALKAEIAPVRPTEVD